VSGPALDNNGNTLSKTDSIGTRTYTWDFENRLTSVVLPGTGGTVTFEYDPFGRRIQKAFTQNSTTAVTNYLYDLQIPIQEVDSGGSELARYPQGSVIDEPLAMARAGATSFYEQDGIGSITSLSGSTGTVSNSYTYDAFGNLTASTGLLVNPFQFTGRDYDQETGLRYYRARYYDSTAGRFLNEDPINFDGGNNFYRYVDNNPAVFRDPLGLQSTGTMTGWTVEEEEAYQAFVQALERGSWLTRLGPLVEYAPALVWERIDPQELPTSLRPHFPKPHARAVDPACAGKKLPPWSPTMQAEKGKASRSKRPTPPPDLGKGPTKPPYQGPNLPGVTDDPPPNLPWWAWILYWLAQGQGTH
jgi:RHS repeat-associated protein